MNSMFSCCESLESINLSSFNTNNVIDMSYMLFGCKSLESIDLSPFNTNNVTNMSYIFMLDYRIDYRIVLFKKL